MKKTILAVIDGARDDLAVLAEAAREAETLAADLMVWARRDFATEDVERTLKAGGFDPAVVPVLRDGLETVAVNLRPAAIVTGTRKLRPFTPYWRLTKRGFNVRVAHATPPTVEPPRPDDERNHRHHPVAHTYSELPPRFAIGSMNLVVDEAS